MKWSPWYERHADTVCVEDHRQRKKIERRKIVLLGGSIWAFMVVVFWLITR